MSKHKYPSIFSRQMEAIVFIFLPNMEAINVHNPSNIFRNTHGLENWGIPLGYSPAFAEDYSVT